MGWAALALLAASAALPAAPDLSGNWTYATLTTLERPREFGTKAFLTAEEAAEYEKKTLLVQDRDRRDGEGPEGRGSDGRTDVDRAVNDVKDQIAKIRADLPRTIDEPLVQRIDIEGLPIVTYSASTPNMNVAALSWFIDDTVARDLQSIQGVASVTRSGGVEREIRI